MCILMSSNITKEDSVLYRRWATRGLAKELYEISSPRFLLPVATEPRLFG